MRAETAPDVMETVANSPSDRRQVGRQKEILMGLLLGLPIWPEFSAIALSLE